MDQEFAPFFLDFSELQSTYCELSSHISDPNLISGLFTAIICFAEETLGIQSVTNNKTDFISVKSNVYHFRKVKDFYFVIEIDSFDTTLTKEDIEELIDQIQTLFFHMAEAEEIHDPSILQVNCPTFIDETKKFVSNIARKRLRKKISPAEKGDLK